MSKKFFVALAFLLVSLTCFAQGQWTWIHGSNLPVNQWSPTRGTTGVAAPTNVPAGSYESIEWKDTSGIFWLLSETGDFWKYDPVTNMWTFLESTFESYGTQGVPSTSNAPGGFGFAAITWTDKNNNLWLFGGNYPLGRRDNVWRYNIATDEWTWMKGAGAVSCVTPVYGTLGVAAPANGPGSRQEVSAYWLDANDNMYFFGGQTCSSGGAGAYADMWKYEAATNNWVWIGGSQTINDAGNYGTKNVPAATNYPPSRMTFASGKLANGNFLLFGGSGWGSGSYNDLWEYDPTTNMWTWIGGPNTGNQAGVYGPACVEGSAYQPGSGQEIRARWTDDCGNFWIFGTDNAGQNINDLWRFSSRTKQWAWIGGQQIPNQPGVYGTLGVASPTNFPAPRKGANPWFYKNELYMFGGIDVGNRYNHMWKYTPDKPTAAYTYTVNSSGGCGSTSIGFSSTSTPGCNEIKSYAWDFGVVSASTDTSSLKDPSFSFPAAGTYNVKLIVTNCTGSKDSLTQTINISSGTTFTVTTSSSSATCASNNGSVTASPTVAGTYTYSWSGAASGQTAATASNLPAGSYTVTVVESGGCNATAAAVVNSVGGPTISSITSTTLNCSYDPGTAVVNTSGGTTPLTYTWNSGSTGQTAFFLYANITYIVTVTDNNSCSTISSILLTAPPPIVLNPTITNNPSCGDIYTSFTESVASGGVPGFTYNWVGIGGNADPFYSGQTIDTSVASLGCYRSEVVDSKGCIAESGGGCLGKPTSGVCISALTKTEPLCNGSAGSIVIDIIGSGGTYSYDWSNGTTSGSVTSALSSYTVTNLSVGNYTVTIVDGLCASITTVSINQPNLISFSVSENTPASCGSNNGIALSTIPTGGTGSYTYLWSSGSTGLTAGNLASSTYTLTVTDANSCVSTSVAIINNSPAPTINSITSTNNLCFASSGGEAVVNASGTGTLTYVWTTGSTGLTSANLSDGTYYVTVADANGCNAISSVAITEPLVISLSSPSTVNATCGSANGSITLSTPSGGTGAYTYSWSNGATTQNVGSLSANNYTVTVLDNNNCSSTTTASIGNSGGPIISAVNSIDPQCSYGTGSATVFATGTGTLTYIWSNGSTSQTAVGLTNGTYFVTVDDVNNCPNASSLTIVAPSPITTLASQNTSASCGNSNGIAIASMATGGTGNYTYSWSNGATGLTVNNLSAGVYSVTVTDANACIFVTTAVVLNSNGPSITSNIITGTCDDSDGGSVDITITGGAAPYSYYWSNGVSSITSSTNNSISLLSDGAYTLTVTDNNNCTITFTATVPLLPDPVIITGADQTITSGNSIQLTASGGISYLWSPAGSLSNAGISDPIASPLVTTTYTIQVTNANSCTATDVVTVTVLEPIKCSANDVFLPTAFSPNNDGQNDILLVRGTGCLSEISLEIFDRWGEKLFESTDPAVGWDGSKNGKQMDSGVYIYKLAVELINKESISKKGSISLIR